MRRAGRLIVRHVELKVALGELIFLIRISGAGKSTCAKAGLGLTDIDGGTVERTHAPEIDAFPQRPMV